MGDAESKRQLRRQLRQHKLDRGLSVERLCREIYEATNIKISPPTLIRFLDNEHRTRDVYINAFRRYLSGFEEIHW